MFLRCSKQWEFRYIKNKKTPPAGAMIQGSAYHGALEANYKQKIKSKKDLPVSDVLDAYVTTWDERIHGKPDAVGEIEDVGEINWEDNDPDDLKQQGLEIVKLYHSRMANKIQPVKAEQKYEKVLPSGVKFIGVVDLETKNEIVDHKLRGKRMSQNDADNDIQPLSYCLLTGKKKFSYHCAIKSRIPIIEEIKLRPKTKSDVNWWAEAIEKFVAAMQSGSYPPNPMGWHCSERFCGYWSLCKGAA